MRMCPFDRLPVCPGHAMPSPHCTFSPFDRPSFDFAAPCVLCPSFFFSASKPMGSNLLHTHVVSNFIFLHYWRSMQKTVTAGLFFMSKKNKQHLSIVYIVTEPSYCSIYETNQSAWLSFCLLPAVVLFSGTEQQNHATTWSSSSCRPIHHLVLLM